MSPSMFEKMPRKDLIAYVLSHPDDQEAIHALANRTETSGVKVKSPEHLAELMQYQNSSERTS